MTRKEALILGNTRYEGKICAKHPSLNGERYTKGRHCPMCAAEKTKTWRGINLEAYLKNRREYDEGHKSNRAARGRKWVKAHPDKSTARANLKRATKLQATPKWANSFFIEEAYALAKVREQVVGGKWHVDHIVPLRSKLVCGLHVEHNLRVIPAQQNLAKGNTWLV